MVPSSVRLVLPPVRQTREEGPSMLWWRFKMSLVWTFFTVSTKDNKNAICNACKAEVSRGGAAAKSFNTSNLISHLKFKHPDIYKEYASKSGTSKQQARDERATPAAGKTLIKQAFDSALKYSKDSAKAKSITRKITEMIALDDQPFSVVEDKGFRQLMDHIEPRYVMPSRHYFSHFGLPELYEDVSARIRELLDNNTSDFSFTTDIWTSTVSQISMLSLTAQWINKDFILQKAVLHAKNFSGSHTGIAIANSISTC
ncbi:hypothetical protein WMY93_030515 [Mugilogobius chulae]|uniref:BED-type domain-containing protein n=1 Tax=Mugilogobius chulae TaxID=88201 RepID=A0AAW0MPG0_9GOBI